MVEEAKGLEESTRVASPIRRVLNNQSRVQLISSMNRATGRRDEDVFLNSRRRVVMSMRSMGFHKPRPMGGINQVCLSS